MRNIPFITPEQVYVTVFRQAPVTNAEGWSKEMCTDRTPPLSGSLFVDRVVEIVRSCKTHDTRLIASRLGVSSVDEINASMRLHAGCNVRAFAINYLLTEAKELIRHTRMNSTEIAHFIGIKNREAFVRAFQRHTGKSFTDWRKANHRPADVGKYLL